MTLDIDVRDLLGQPGTSRTIRVSESIPGLGNELAAVPQDDQVEAELLLESVVEGVLASGPMTGPLAMVCARCLVSFRSEFHLDVHELFTPDAGIGDDEYRVNEGAIDLEPMIRDAVLLSMPFAPLCRPDCLGLCERCGGDRNIGECVCAPAVDPRWAPLSGIDLERVERKTDVGG
jgi:DUF177 domain-containing protein